MQKNEAKFSSKNRLPDFSTIRTQSIIAKIGQRMFRKDALDSVLHQ